MFGGNFAPIGWKFCNGDLLRIDQNDALYALLGTTYGGDGVNTFALPDLRGRIPISQGLSTTGTSYNLGQSAGTESVTLLTSQLPVHTHPVAANAQGADLLGPGTAVWGAGTTKMYSDVASDSSMNAGAIGLTGGNNPHDNMMPYLGLSFIIAIEGVFPSQG